MNNRHRQGYAAAYWAAAFFAAGALLAALI
jgi:hypothetical protein